MQTLGIFILFLFPLVMFHEFGHFIVAKLCGVGVETFSIGFGPKLLKKKIGETEYAFSLIPLGGYVKMMGENLADQNEDLTEEEKKKCFNRKNRWQRLAIVAAGPIFNIIFAFVIYFGLAACGERVPELKVGVVENSSPLYELGVRTADVLVAVDDRRVEGPADVDVDETTFIKRITVKRFGNGEVILPINMQGLKFFEQFNSVPQYFRMPLFLNNRGELFIATKNALNVDWDKPLEEMILEQPKRVYLFKVKDVDAKKADLTNKIEIELSDFNKSLRERGFYAMDLLVEKLTPSSTAKKAGMEERDIVYKIDDQELYSFTDLRKIIDGPKTKIKMHVVRNDGSTHVLEVEPEVQTFEGVTKKMIGVQSGGYLLPPGYVELPPKGIVESITTAWKRTIDIMERTWSGLYKLVSAQVSLNSMGGPIAIGKIASDSFRMSFTFFMQFMAMISVNLALINLVPIPILDGGHIMFIIIEFFNRGPLSPRKIEIAQFIGLSFLLFLMVAAVFNDVVRFL